MLIPRTSSFLSLLLLFGLVLFGFVWLDSAVEKALAMDRDLVMTFTFTGEGPGSGQGQVPRMEGM